jgi:hypothetical protein
MSYELLKKFTDTVIPEEMKSAIKSGFITMPRNLVKMVLFTKDSQIKNEDVDYWMSFGPARQQDETFIEYKQRQKFQKALTKYRSYLYNYDKSTVL